MTCFHLVAVLVHTSPLPGPTLPTALRYRQPYAARRAPPLLSTRSPLRLRPVDPHFFPLPARTSRFAAARAPVARMTAARRARPAPPWVAGAARSFGARGLPRPTLYGAPPRRDVIGWVAALLAARLTPRWLALCAALRMRHPFGGDEATQDDAMAAVAAAVVEEAVRPLLPGESKRVLTTNVRRHVRRSAVAGLTFMHVFDFHLAVFDLAEALHNSRVGALTPGEVVPTGVVCGSNRAGEIGRAHV